MKTADGAALHYSIGFVLLIYCFSKIRKSDPLRELSIL